MSLIKDGPFAHFDCGEDCRMPTSPFRVKEFHLYVRETSANGPVCNVADDMNEWFDTITEDEANEYDIRQILKVDGAVLVFYEMTPAEPQSVLTSDGIDTANMAG
jgi:hypothetical protein